MKTYIIRGITEDCSSSFEAAGPTIAKELAKNWIAAQDWPGRPLYVLALLECEGETLCELPVRIHYQPELPNTEPNERHTP